MNPAEAVANDVEVHEVVIAALGRRGEAAIKDQIFAIHDERAKTLLQDHLGPGARRTYRKFTFGNQHAAGDITSRVIPWAGLNPYSRAMA